MTQTQTEVRLTYGDSDAFIKLNGHTAIKRFQRYYEQNREKIDKAIIENRSVGLYDPKMGVYIGVFRLNPDEPEPVGFVRFYEVHDILPERI